MSEGNCLYKKSKDSQSFGHKQGNSTNAPPAPNASTTTYEKFSKKLFLSRLFFRNGFEVKRCHVNRNKRKNVLNEFSDTIIVEEISAGSRAAFKL
jgi:hypothetical protein